MFKLYRRQHDAQIRWIRNHPVQYVTLNVTLLVLYFGYIEIKDRRKKREFQLKANEVNPAA